MAMHLFMHLLLDGYLACSHFLLWILLLWIFVYKCLCGHAFSFLLGIDLRVALLGHIVTLYLTFCGTAKLFSQAAVPFYISPSSLWGFHFLYILTNTCCYHLFHYNYSGEYEVVFHCKCDLHFLIANEVEHFFMCLLAFLYLLWKTVISDPLSISLNWDLCLFIGL